MVGTTACGGGAVRQPAAAQEKPPQASGGQLTDDVPSGHAGPPCPVKAATTQLCFRTKEAACRAMGCPERCMYLYGTSAASEVACE